MNVILPAPAQQKTRVDAHAHAAANMITVILGSPAHFAASAKRKITKTFSRTAHNESCRNSLKNALPTYMNVLRSAPRATKHAYTHTRTQRRI